MKNYVFIETEYWLVKLSEKDQRYLGRSYVTLKRKCASLSELTEKEMIDFLHLVRQVESLMKKTFGAVMFNWTCLMNDAYQAEYPDPQVHWHMRPRYNKEVVVAGEIFVDTEFGHHYNREPEKNKKLSEAILNEIYHQLL
ncbi:HIT family protein [Patescibacteria group bacterium]|nr:HIT family protein [Patescibacteria group bacterium]